MALVVRMRRQSCSGAEWKARSASQSRSTGATASGATGCQAALVVADAEALGDSAEDVDPAGLAGDGGIDEGQGSVEAAVAVGGGAVPQIDPRHPK